MDNLTHSLVGLAAAKAGLERQSPYATFVCVAAANLPDIDIVALAGGPSFYLQHHRGITHSLVGMLALAFVFPLLFTAGERLWARLGGREPRARLKGLVVCSVLLSVSHPLLDWTNSYGVRPLLPWDGRWFYGDLLFIVDPWVWLLLGGACSLLATTQWRAAAWWLGGLLCTVVFFRVTLADESSVPLFALGVWAVLLFTLVVLHAAGIGRRFGVRVAQAGLALVVVYCGALWFVQRNALGTAEMVARNIAGADGARVLRVAATPVLADPSAWRCLAETDRSTFRFDMRLDRDNFKTLPRMERFKKPEGEEAEVVRRASEPEAARVLLDFARFPVARVRRAAAGGWVVQFADLRYTEPGARARIGGFALDVPVDSAAPAGR